jgi:hypothetical protein
VESPQIQPACLPATFAVEWSFGSALDRSLSLVKRSFAAELSSMLRLPGPPGTLSAVDEFTDQLVTDIDHLIDVPIPPLAESKALLIARRLSAAIDDEMRPAAASLAAAESRDLVVSSQHLAELHVLQNQLGLLGTEFKARGDCLLRELDRERANFAAHVEAEQISSRELEARNQSLGLLRVELEARQGHAKAQRANIDRTAAQYHQRRRQWEEEAKDGPADAARAIRRRLAEEIGILRDEMRSADVAQMIDESVRILAQDGEQARNRLTDLEAIVRNMPQRNVAQAAARPNKREKSRILAEAESKVSKLRRRQAIRSPTEPRIKARGNQ